MFHVDFGFIFGKNPKGKNKWSPPVKICKEMVTCMGDRYQYFEDKCVEAFKYLRNHSKYIMNLFYLMIHAGIKDLPANQADKILLQIYDKFLPNITDPI